MQNTNQISYSEIWESVMREAVGSQRPRLRRVANLLTVGNSDSSCAFLSGVFRVQLFCDVLTILPSQSFVRFVVLCALCDLSKRNPNVPSMSDRSRLNYLNRFTCHT